MRSVPTLWRTPSASSYGQRPLSLGWNRRTMSPFSGVPGVPVGFPARKLVGGVTVVTYGGFANRSMKFVVALLTALTLVMTLSIGTTGTPLAATVVRAGDDGTNGGTPTPGPVQPGPFVPGPGQPGPVDPNNPGGNPGPVLPPQGSGGAGCGAPPAPPCFTAGDVKNLDPNQFW